ncbi:hypothetical protein PINS_up003661 [Pythium insidiosum]|nr:hypothetical protein PINS_up003661 [Pythium insidiosum]
MEEERKRIQDKKEEERRQKEAERRYPIEDLELLVDGTHNNVIPIQLKSWEVFDGKLLGDLVMVWQTINNFTAFNNLERITLQALASSIAEPSANGTSSALVGIFMAFLRAILSEKSFVSPMDDLVVEGNTTVADLFANTERTYGICERSYMEILSPVTWQEILRQLMAKDIGIDASIGNIEPLVGCEIVRQTLYMQNNSAPFNSPVDTTIKGLEDYTQIVQQPMDLGTIRRKIQDGSYEATDGHNEFAADVRLVWDNCVLYNGEDSDIGRAALSLSDIFEQDFGRLVIGRIGANKSRLEASRELLTKLDESKEDWSDRSLVDIVHGLYVREFHELPVSFKLGALSWICTEFLKLESVRAHIESQAEAEFEVLREYRRKLGEIDAKRKAAEKSRREKEALFRQSCIDQGIEPNSNNQFSDAVKQQHEFIAAFYSEIQGAKQADDTTWHDERQFVEAELQSSMDGLCVRLSPLGKDRFHNCYWLFVDGNCQRLFIEKSDSGEFVEPSTVKDVDTILAWLNPKGIRESDLLGKLTPMKEALAGSFRNEAPNTGAMWRCPFQLQVNLFPLPGFRYKDDHQLHFNHEPSVIVDEVTKQMLLAASTELLSATSSSQSHPIMDQIKETASFDSVRALAKKLEMEVVASKCAGDTVRHSWKRKRREWLLALDGSHTYSQLGFLLHLFLAECVNAEAFLDLSVRLDKKEWMKLRPKECRNFIPEVGKTIVYFGDGHAQALREDSKVKKKRFTRKSDPPLPSTTLLCTIVDISFYHGGGDPYALLVMKPIEDIAEHSCARSPGSCICPPPTPSQQLARVLVRITSKLRAHPDSAPFMDPVSDRDFPEYKEIIPRPMDLSKVHVKARKCEYASAADFLDDIRLICNNCELFCEGRFPDLPPLARNLVDLAEAMVKKSQKEIRSIEQAMKGSDTKRVENERGSGNVAMTGTPTKTSDRADDTPEDVARHRDELLVVWRLENRLPEYVVDLKRYEAAVARTWKCGERFRMLFRDPKGFPSEYYNGSTAGSLPFTSNGLLPWEALRVVWDEDDGSNDSRLNPWEIEVTPEGRKGRG